MKEVLEMYGMKGYINVTDLPMFDHYFRHLYRILKFVHEADYIESYEERYKYTSLVRAILSRYELFWIYYNCLSDIGNTKFKPLIEKYTLLKNLRFELLPTSLETKNVSNHSGNDFEFFMTKSSGNKAKYTPDAFFRGDELTDALSMYCYYLLDNE